MTHRVSVVLAFMLSLAFAAPVLAGSSFLPRIRLPRINGGKAIQALTYPVAKSLVNGGKTVLKAGETADALGVVPNIGPPPVSRVVKRALWVVGRH